MQFWSDIAAAGGERYLKSYCFGTNISAPTPGYAFADYNRPRGLETFEPCSMENFAAYGLWFQQRKVPAVEKIDVLTIDRRRDHFVLTLADGRQCCADHVVVATGLTSFAVVPAVLASLRRDLAIHTSEIASFASFKGLDVAVLGAGQSALEAAALLHEAGARPQLLIRENSILWQTRVSQKRGLWRRLRSPISGLGTGPKAWALTHFPGAMHRVPDRWRSGFVRSHLPPEGAWWLRDRVECKVPVQLGTAVVGASETAGRVRLELSRADDSRTKICTVDRVVLGTGYDVDIERLGFLEPKLRGGIKLIGRAPRLNAEFETSVPELYFIGPASAMSFGPLFRFVVGAEYTVRVLSAHLAAQVLRAR
jgi:hypothetical protein